jgi:hypothetical protein
MKTLADILEKTKNLKRPKNLTTEFQHYGVFLAEILSDTKHYSLYIRLAKNTERGLLEEALAYTKGYTAAKSKARVFMWRLAQLKKLKKEMQTAVFISSDPQDQLKQA